MGVECVSGWGGLHWGWVGNVWEEGGPGGGRGDGGKVETRRVLMFTCFFLQRAG